MESSTARNNAFAQLMVGARFQKKRFANDIAKFQPQLKSPQLAAARAPGRNVQKVDFFEDTADGATSDGATTDMGSEIGDDAAPAGKPAAKPPPKLGKKAAAELRKEQHIKAAGENVPSPITDFKQLAAWYPLPERIARNMFERGMRAPTPIQMQGLPCLMEQKDFIGVAPTGSGKTLTFLLPMLARLKRPKKTGLRGLIISHTKELAAQTERELRYLCRGMAWGIQTMGSSKVTVGAKDILCSTPGRLMSFVKEQQLDLSKVEFVVFDEADQLFDISHDTFYDVMKETLALCTSEKRQTVVLCATLPEKCEGIIREFLRPDLFRVMIGTRASASKDVEQRLEYCGKESGKVAAIQQFLLNGITPPVLIFVQSKDRAKDLYVELLAKNVSVAAIHSERTAAQRDDTIKQFRMGKVHILICTELMARGVDLKGVQTVINYDFPTSIQSYVHRVGRTGRAGRKGLAITLWTDEDRGELRAIAHIIKSAQGDVPEWMLTLPKFKNKKVTKQAKKRIRGLLEEEEEDGSGGEEGGEEGAEKKPDSEKDAAQKERIRKIKAQAAIMPVKRESISAVRRVKEAEARDTAFRKRARDNRAKRKDDDDDDGSMKPKKRRKTKH
eukprot:TRINITY_DN1759_c4_g1_i1.p1 TRINITY_DN1759_c4_g1~~TRINITY_DN1759_c4_g1_i1.p1  ORF type:complete len:615 (+),score=292.80 TRINITY_DN1759_c4_g1_i1:65-1909(+)